MTGLGLGSVAISGFLKQIVFADPGVGAVIADPEEANLRSLRAFEKAGIKVTNTVQLVGESFKRRIVRLDRPSLLTRLENAFGNHSVDSLGPIH